MARVAGLLPPSLPGRAPRSLRALQTSSALIYDVLREHDPAHLLLGQAEAEVRQQQLRENELDELLRRLSALPRDEVALTALSPLAFPLWAESQRGHLSNEDWRTRVQRAAARLERGLER